MISQTRSYDLGRIVVSFLSWRVSAAGSADISLAHDAPADTLRICEGAVFRKFVWTRESPNLVLIVVVAVALVQNGPFAVAGVSSIQAVPLAEIHPLVHNADSPIDQSPSLKFVLAVARHQPENRDLFVAIYHRVQATIGRVQFRNVEEVMDYRTYCETMAGLLLNLLLGYC